MKDAWMKLFASWVANQMIGPTGLLNPFTAAELTARLWKRIKFLRNKADDLRVMGDLYLVGASTR